MLKFIDIEQNTDEWFQLRAGRLTSSKLGVIMASNNEYSALTLGKNIWAIADTKAGKLLKLRFETKIEALAEIESIKKKDLKKSFGQPAKQYAVSIAVEQITGKPISSNYSNDHMERGHEQEPIARMLYEEETFCEVSNGGFFSSDFIGCSPDGLVLDCGAIEIKSVISSVHYANVKRQGVDPAYKWQCIANLMFTGRSWLDFVSYCADFPEDKQLFTHRLHKEQLQNEFKMIRDRIEEFKKLVSDSKTLIENSNYSPA